MSQAVLQAETGVEHTFRLRRFLSTYSFAFALVLSAGLFIVNLIIQDGGLGITQQLANFAPIALAAIASAPAIMAGSFDFTISPLMFFACCIFVVWLVPHGLGGPVGVPLVLLITGVAGAIQGLAVYLLRAQTVVVTLSLYFILIGIDLFVAPKPRPLEQGNWIRDLAGSFGPIPGGALTIGLPLLIWFLLRFLPLRSLIFAVGSNEATAYTAGVNVPLIRVIAYAIGGVFAGVGGLALCALLGSATAVNVTSYTLIGISGVVLGGNSLWGGRGTLIGPLLGAAMIYQLRNLLTNMNVNPSWLQVLYGIMLIFAVLLSGLFASKPSGITG